MALDRHPFATLAAALALCTLATPARADDDDLVAPPPSKTRPAKPAKKDKDAGKKKKAKPGAAKSGPAAAAPSDGDRDPAALGASPADAAPQLDEPVIEAPPHASSYKAGAAPAKKVYDAPKPETPPATASENKKAEPPPLPEADLGFDLLGATAPEKPAEVDPRVAQRRSMLTYHQASGLVTAAAMIGTVVLGQLNYSDRFAAGGDSSGRFELAHTLVATGTTAAFAAAGLLAVFAPVPYERKDDGLDSAMVHKICLGGATVGMATEIGLGILTVKREGYANQGPLAAVHLGVGYATAALLFAGAAFIIFLPS